MIYTNPPQFIDTQEDFDQFIALHKDVKWIGFDTEFIGENRLIPLLCLIQISSVHGIYLLDPIKLKTIAPLLAWFEDPNILKITHAGNNDYALLHALYTTIPQNVFDVQIAAGFLGYSYPIGFQKMIKEILGKAIGKAAGVTDWSLRPLSQKQAVYAADDVRYLYSLWKHFSERLNKTKKAAWAEEEFAIMVKASTCGLRWQDEYLKFKQLSKLHKREKAFMLKLIHWRTQKADELNKSKDAILPQKMFMEILKSINESQKEITKHRLLNRSKIRRNWPVFQQLWADTSNLNPEEKALLKIVNNIRRKTPEENLRYAFLKLMIKQRCYEFGIPEGLVVNGMGLSNPILENFPSALTYGWRGEMLGETLVDWLEHKSPLIFEFEKSQCIVRRKK